jgi:thiosulfate dehydrogenase
VKRTLILCIAAAAAVVCTAARADEFGEEDLKRWQAQFDTVVKEGRSLWTSADIGKNGVVCAQCHPNAANTHPETYPKFQKQLGKVANLWEMVNWCLRNPLQGDPLAADDPRMTAMLAYIAFERRGVKLEPGKH